MLGDAREHLRADFDSIMKRPNVIAADRMRQNCMRASLGLYGVTVSEKRAENLRCFRAGPAAQRREATETVNDSLGSFSSSMRSARTRKARACTEVIASFSVFP